MIKKSIVIIFTLLFSGCINIPEEKMPKPITTLSRGSISERISILFQIESLNSFALSPENERRFYSALPNTFEEFRIIYTKRHKLKDGRNLYLSIDYHFETLLPNLYYIKKEVIIKKLLSISLNGNWEPDAISLFQKSVQLQFASEVILACKALKSHSDSEILSFWYFYFDGPHPESYKMDFEVLFSRYNKVNSRIADLMKQSYQKLLRESEGYGH